MSLAPHEQVVLDRLAASNPLGWKPVGRDEKGQGILEATLPGGEGKLRVVRCVLTPAGMVHFVKPHAVVDAN